MLYINVDAQFFNITRYNFDKFHIVIKLKRFFMHLLHK